MPVTVLHFGRIALPVAARPRCRASIGHLDGDAHMVGFSHVHRQLYFVQLGSGVEAFPATRRTQTGLDWLDCALICLFLLGLYTNYTIQISAKVPFPSLPAALPG
jgi:hypothetical protein